MRAELFKRGYVGAEIPEIPGFEIPKAHYQAILDSLNGSARDFFPLTWQGLGLIDIRLSTGSISVALCWTGHESGAFISNGSYYRGASDSEFVQIIEAASHHKSEP